MISSSSQQELGRKSFVVPAISFCDGNADATAFVAEIRRVAEDLLGALPAY